MSYAIGNVASLIAARNVNLNLSKTTAAKLEKLQLPLPGDSEADKPSDNKALIVGALVVAGIAAFALRR
jgi:hypothetical protein